ncbi:hypothetical protein ACH42_06525 [Endozoicomonas sp. (ex Bugula neritina AB1)]|nr:hypothetical protein ACH42_06525 [Endozoicomonas sp. (ex Bugula neritina AB1)]
MANQSVNRMFWRYTIPAIVGMLVNGLYSTIDGIFIGQVVGTEGLAAINLIWPIYGLVVGAGLMIGMGSSALSSIARGEGATEKARIIMGSGIVLVFLTGLLFAVLVLPFTETLIVLMGASEAVLTMAQNYLFYVIAFAVLSIGGAAAPMLVRNDERPQLATIIMSVGAILNIVLDYLFIVVWEQGVSGAAIATVIAQAVTMIWGFGYFFSNKANLQLSLKDLRFNLRLFKGILTTGLPSFIMFAYMSFVLAVHNSLFLIYGSVTTLAAFTIVGYVQAMYYMTAEGIANGIQPIVSYSHGAGNNRNIHATLWLGMKVALGIGLATVAFINLFPETIAYVFNSDDPQLLKETTLGLHLHLMTMFLDGFIVVAAAYFQSVAKTKAATIITMGNILIQAPLLITLPPLFGVTGVWLALPISNIFLAAATLWILLKDLKSRPAQKEPDQA